MAISDTEREPLLARQHPSDQGRYFSLCGVKIPVQKTTLAILGGVSVVAVLCVSATIFSTSSTETPVTVLQQSAPAALQSHFHVDGTLTKRPTTGHIVQFNYSYSYDKFTVVAESDRDNPEVHRFAKLNQTREWSPSDPQERTDPNNPPSANEETSEQKKKPSSQGKERSESESKQYKPQRGGEGKEQSPSSSTQSKGESKSQQNEPQRFEEEKGESPSSSTRNKGESIGEQQEPERVDEESQGESSSSSKHGKGDSKSKPHQSQRVDEEGKGESPSPSTGNRGESKGKQHEPQVVEEEEKGGPPSSSTRDKGDSKRKPQRVDDGQGESSSSSVHSKGESERTQDEPQTVEEGGKDKSPSSSAHSKGESERKQHESQTVEEEGKGESSSASAQSEGESEKGNNEGRSSSHQSHSSRPTTSSNVSPSLASDKGMEETRKGDRDIESEQSQGEASVSEGHAEHSGHNEHTGKGASSTPPASNTRDKISRTTAAPTRSREPGSQFADGNEGRGNNDNPTRTQSPFGTDSRRTKDEPREAPTSSAKSRVTERPERDNPPVPTKKPNANDERKQENPNKPNADTAKTTTLPASEPNFTPSRNKDPNGNSSSDLIPSAEEGKRQGETGNEGESTNERPSETHERKPKNKTANNPEVSSAPSPSHTTTTSSITEKVDVSHEGESQPKTEVAHEATTPTEAATTERLSFFERLFGRRNQEKAAPTVRTSLGSLKGVNLVSRDGREYFGFYNVPYAEPPVGELRFKPPVPVKKWRGTKDATVKGTMCVQKSRYNPDVDVEGSEDCLHMNIFTPKLPRTLRRVKYPVIVYFFGGGFMHGTANDFNTDYFMDENVVMVIVESRVGALGYLNTGDLTVTGNMGLKDQVEALKWVKGNIAKFGGDPAKVVAFGSSSGAMCAHGHLVSPMSAGLMKGVISFSGTLLSPNVATLEYDYDPGATADKFGSAMGCSGFERSEDLVSCLRNVSFQEIALKQPFEFGPTVEAIPENGDTSNAFFTDFPLDYILKGEVNAVPWLVGANDAELILNAYEILLNETQTKALNEDFDNFMGAQLFLTNWSDEEELTDILHEIRQFYFGDQRISGELGTRYNLTNVLSDRMHFHPTRLSGLEHSKKSSVYWYYLTKEANVSFAASVLPYFDPPYGVSHADEVQYVFSRPRYPYIPLNTQWTDFSKMFVKFLVSFASEGHPVNPDPEGVEWPAVDPNGNGEVWYNLDDVPKLIEPFTDRMELWDSFPFQLVYNSSSPVL